MAKPKPYTRAQFEAEFPDEDSCLDALFNLRFGKLPCCPFCGVVEAKFYRILERRCYACMHCRHQLFPTAQTIMHKSTSPLRDWFWVIYLVSISKNGIAALEVQRHIGGSYKRCWRMVTRVRQTMKQGDTKLSGLVEIDECYYGGHRKKHLRWTNKVPIIGATEKYGQLRAKVVDGTNSTTALRFLREHVTQGSVLHSDETPIYNYAAKRYYSRFIVKHGKGEYVRGEVTSNQIEGIWGRFKPSLDATHRAVSKKYLQFYLDEHVWRYNRRVEPNHFQLLLKVAAQQIKTVASM